jgi:hypothetical protein
MLFGEWVRAARENLGWSREMLRRQILIHFDQAPTVVAIRFLETGLRKAPSPTNRLKYLRVLRRGSTISPPSNAQ